MKTIEFAKYELHKYAAAMGACPNLTLSVEPGAFDGTRFFRFDAAYA